MDNIKITLKHDPELAGLLQDIVDGSIHPDMGSLSSQDRPLVPDLIELEMPLTDPAQNHAIIKQLVLVEGLVPKFTYRQEEVQAKVVKKSAPKNTDQQDS